jgi:ammonia channel protein AmtB
VNSLAWDADMSILYLGGSFHAIGNTTISSGLAMWTKRTGLIDFPGGGVLHSDGGVGNTQVKSIAYEPKSEVRF